MLRIVEDQDGHALYRTFILESGEGEIACARFRADRIPTDAIRLACHAPGLADGLRLLEEAGGEVFRIDLTDTE